jgi:CheY-like chemotaxis protein
MDINMPEMDGFQATEIIKELINKGDLKYKPFICVLTAYATDVFK